MAPVGRLLDRLLRRAPRISAVKARSSWGLVRLESEDRLVFAEKTGDGIQLALPADEAEGGKSLRGPHVVAVLSHPLVRHERLELPPLSKQQIKHAVEQYRVTQGVSEGESEASYCRLGSGASTDVLITSVPMDVAEGAFGELSESGYHVDALVSPIVAMVGLLSECSTVLDETTASMIVHLGEDIGSVGFVHEGRVLLGRDFRMPQRQPVASFDGASLETMESEAERAPLESTGGEELDAVVGEIQRSLLYFRHQFRGQEVGRVLVSSDVAGLEERVARCNERLTEPVQETIRAIRLDKADVPGANPYVSAIAAAVVGVSGYPAINLVPHRVQRERRTRALRRASFVAIAAATAAMAVANVKMLARNHAVRADIRAELERNAEVDEAVVVLQNTYAGRETARTKQAFLRQKRNTIVALTQALRVLSRSEGDSVVVADIELERTQEEGDASGVLTLRVAGSVSDVDQASSQSQFNTFYEDVTGHERFAETDLEPLELTTIDGRRSVLSYSFSTRISES